MLEMLTAPIQNLRANGPGFPQPRQAAAPTRSVSFAAPAPASQKAIERESIVREPRLGGAIGAAGGAKRRLGSNPTARTYLNAYGGGTDAIDWVMDCVGLIGETASAADWHLEKNGSTLYDRQTTKDLPEDGEWAPEDLVKLLKKPNPYQTWADLIELHAIDYFVAGDSFWWLYGAGTNGRPQSIIRCHPSEVNIILNERGGIAEYEYTPTEGGKAISIPKQHMIHDKRANPHHRYYGAGVIAGSPQVYDLELNLTSSANDYYRKGTRLSGVLSTEKTVPAQVFEKIKNVFKDFYSGSANAYDVAVLEKGLTYQPVANSASDAEYVAVSNFSRDRILAGFRVGAPLLGLVGGSDRQAVAEAQRIFDNKRMRPYLDKLQHSISLKLTQAWDVNLVIDYEYLPPKEDQIELAGVIASLPGIKLSEVREAAGYGPLGDERDDIVLNLPGDEENGSSIKDRPLPGEGGRPPNGENTETFPEEGEALPSNARAKRAAARTRGQKAYDQFVQQHGRRPVG